MQSQMYKSGGTKAFKTMDDVQCSNPNLTQSNFTQILKKDSTRNLDSSSQNVHLSNLNSSNLQPQVPNRKVVPSPLLNPFESL